VRKTNNNISISDHLAALSEPVRLRLLRLCERDELSVGELARVVQQPQSTVSRHLKVLHDDGWLAARFEGTSTLYRLAMDDLSSAQRALWVPVRSQLDQDTPGLDDDMRRLSAVLAERKLDTRTFFGRVAGEWDSVRNELFGDRVTLLALLNLVPPDWTVADLGCGTGNAAELIAPCVKRVLAVDQSDAMLDAARKRCADHSNVDFLRGDLEHLPITDGSVDAAVCVLVMHHIEDPAQVCREMARILRPGGVAMIVDMVEHDRAAYRQTMGHRWLGFGVPILIRMLGDAGLGSAKFQMLRSESDAKGPGLFACTARKP